jgi:hypothetical protein
MKISWIDKVGLGGDRLTPIDEHRVAITGDAQGMGLYDLAARRMVWHHAGGGTRRPQRYGARQLVVVADAEVRVHDLDSGTVERQIALPARRHLPPVLLGDTLYVAAADEALRVDLLAGQIVEHLPLGASAAPLQAPLWLEGALWVFTGDGDGAWLEGLRSGQAAVRHRLPAPSVGPGLLHKGVIHFAATDGRLYGVRAGGELELDCKVLPGGGVLGAPVLHKGQLLVYADDGKQKRGVFALDLRKKRILKAESVDLRPAELPPLDAVQAVDALIAGEHGIYLTTPWFDVVELAGPTIIDRSKLPAGDLHHLSSSKIVTNRGLYVLALFEDGGQVPGLFGDGRARSALHAAIMCLGRA